MMSDVVSWLLPDTWFLIVKYTQTWKKWRQVDAKPIFMLVFDAENKFEAVVFMGSEDLVCYKNSPGPPPKHSLIWVRRGEYGKKLRHLAFGRDRLFALWKHKLQILDAESGTLLVETTFPSAVAVLAWAIAKHSMDFLCLLYTRNTRFQIDRVLYYRNQDLQMDHQCPQICERLFLDPLRPHLVWLQDEAQVSTWNTLTHEVTRVALCVGRFIGVDINSPSKLQFFWGQDHTVYLETMQGTRLVVTYPTSQFHYSLLQQSNLLFLRFCLYPSKHGRTSIPDSQVWILDYATGNILHQILEASFQCRILFGFQCYGSHGFHCHIIDSNNTSLLTWFDLA